jgi:hypothetical protein
MHQIAAHIAPQTDILLKCEVHSEATNVKRSKMIAVVFPATRHLAEALSSNRTLGFQLKPIQF